MNPSVLVEHLRHEYGARVALEDVSLSARAGQILGLLGPNGSGKTTLFRILCTLIPPASGRVTIDGLDVAANRDQVRQRLAVVFQSPSLDRQLTAEENLRYHGRLHGLRRAELNARIEANLKRVGLWERRRERVDRFSGGMRRRVELAKGLLTRPRILILDEPSTGLDPVARNELMTALQAVRDEGVTVLLTTHLMEEADRCDLLVILDRGRVVAEGSPLELRQQIGGEVVSIASREPQRLVDLLRERFDIAAERFDATVRFESPDAPALIPKLAEALPGLIDTLTLGRPGLNDVFIRLTGHRFD